MQCGLFGFQRIISLYLTAMAPAAAPKQRPGQSPQDLPGYSPLTCW